MTPRSRCPRAWRGRTSSGAAPSCPERSSGRTRPSSSGDSPAVRTSTGSGLRNDQWSKTPHEAYGTSGWGNRCAEAVADPEEHPMPSTPRPAVPAVPGLTLRDTSPAALAERLVPILRDVPFPARRWQVVTAGEIYGCDGVTREILARLPEAEYTHPAGPPGRPLRHPHRPARAPQPDDARRRSLGPRRPSRRPGARAAPRGRRPAAAHAAARRLTPLPAPQSESTGAGAQRRVQRRTTVSKGTSTASSPGTRWSRRSRAARRTSS